MSHRQCQQWAAVGSTNPGICHRANNVFESQGVVPVTVTVPSSDIQSELLPSGAVPHLSCVILSALSEQWHLRSLASEQSDFYPR